MSDSAVVDARQAPVTAKGRPWTQGMTQGFDGATLPINMDVTQSAVQCPGSAVHPTVGTSKADKTLMTPGESQDQP